MHSSDAKYSLGELVLFTQSGTAQYRRIDKIHSHVVTYVNTDDMVHLHPQRTGDAQGFLQGQLPMFNKLDETQTQGDIQ